MDALQLMGIRSRYARQVGHILTQVELRCNVRIIVTSRIQVYANILGRVRELEVYSIPSWPRNQMRQLVGLFAGGWVGPLTYLFAVKRRTHIPARNRTPFPVVQAVAWFLSRHTGKKEERITNSVSVQDMNALRTTYRVMYCEFNLFLCLISGYTRVSLALIQSLCPLFLIPSAIQNSRFCIVIV